MPKAVLTEEEYIEEARKAYKKRTSLGRVSSIGILPAITTTDDVEMEDARIRFGENMGKLSARNSSASPFRNRIVQLKAGLGMFAVIATISPFLIIMSNDRISMQLAMFLMLLLFSFMVLGLYHSTRCEEMHLKIRSCGYSAGLQLSSEMVMSCILFVVSLLIQIVESIIASRMEDGIPIPYVVILAVATDVNVFGAFALLVQCENTYIINDL